MSVVEVHARMTSIVSRIDGLATGRAGVDPLLLEAFESQMRSAAAGLGPSGTAAGGTGAAPTSALPAAGGPNGLGGLSATPSVRGAAADAAGASSGAAGVQATARPAWASTGGDLATIFAEATDRYRLPAGLLCAVARRESGLRVDAVSPAGARGLMQLMPGTARELGVDPMDPVQAVDGAARYLRAQLDTFGSLDLALAAYNAGPGAVRRHGGIPPYAETRAYVTAITSALQTGRAA